MAKTCADCSKRYLQDFGYSNYTVEGTDIGCTLNKNPAYPTAEPHYAEKGDEPHIFAETCGFYVEGDTTEVFAVEDDCPYPKEGE